MSLFNADLSMRSGPKSELLKLTMEVAHIEPLENLPDLSPSSTQYVIDGMAQVYRISTKGLALFGEYIERYCQSIFRLPGSRIDIIMDRYDVPSIKDQK